MNSNTLIKIAGALIALLAVVFIVKSLIVLAPFIIIAIIILLAVNYFKQKKSGNTQADFDASSFHNTASSASSNMQKDFSDEYSKTFDPNDYTNGEVIDVDDYKDEN